MWCRVFRFWHQNRQLRFGDLSLKITATVSLFGTQNQAGFGLSLVPQNRRREVGTRHASRSSGLLRVEASRARIFNLTSRLAEARRRMLHVAPSQKLRRSQVEDGRVDAMGCVEPCYPYFTIFILLGPRNIVVI
jgi:hypothetical protein